ncbi:retropepsin-like aspartic protease [Pontiellaceae bacterium B12219]|nr:retropepsin-like aspartic protease [Pontiellaceae bacterium B12219]
MCLFLILWAVAYESAAADQVFLMNGRIIDCTILSETADAVEISLGTGSMNLPRTTIQKIVQTDPASHPETTKPSRRGNILSKQHAPAQYATVASAFRTLMNQRNKATDARYMITHFSEKIRRSEFQLKELNQDIQALNLQLSQKHQQISAIDFPDDTARNRTTSTKKYNEQVHKHNQLSSEMNAIAAKIGPLEQEQQTILRNIKDDQQKQKKQAVPIAQYIKAFHEFLPMYADVKKRLPPNLNGPARELFSTIDRYLARFKAEMEINTIPATHHGHSTMVRAVVNGKLAGDFVFDTGASLMTITESFALELGLNSEDLPKITTLVADGRTVESRLTLLSSVTVGTATVQDVEVIILPDSPNEEQDGLLGMSFLKYFSININGANGEIELIRFSSD